MAVTPDDIAVELGQPTSDVTPEERALWTRWVERTYRLIHRRLGDLEALDQQVLDDVVTLAVARHARLPRDGAESVSEQVGVDDGSMQTTRRYTRAQADVTVLPEWWAMLTGAGEDGGAFSIDMTPARETPLGYIDLRVRPDLWFQWVHPTPDSAP